MTKENEIKKHHHAVMFFYRESDLGISANPSKWVNTNIAYFNDGMQALECYANTRCPASQLVSEETEEELKQAIEQMKKNYNDQQWLNDNLYPFL
jgi:hypothetical protein